MAARDWIQVYSGKGIKGGRNGRHFFEGPGVAGPRGGQIGAVLVSRFIKRGTISTTAYNHYSLLRSIQDFFGLEYLGYAGQKGLKSFGKDIFTQPNGRGELTATRRQRMARNKKAAHAAAFS